MTGAVELAGLEAQPTGHHKPNNRISINIRMHYLISISVSIGNK